MSIFRNLAEIFYQSDEGNRAADQFDQTVDEAVVRAALASMTPEERATIELFQAEQAEGSGSSTGLVAAIFSIFGGK
jgi:hypothetical protein